jgi:membrane-associated phospholipid phosphatase
VIVARCGYDVGLLSRPLLVALATLALAPPAAAQSDAGASVYRLSWAGDLTTMGVAGAAWLVPELFLSSLVTPKCPCNRDDVPWFDRGALGRSSPTARNTSQVAVTAMLVVPPLLDGLDVRRAGGSWAHVGEDVVVMAETLLVNGALNELVKVAVQRPRPFVYSGEGLAERDSYLSFYSSHASNAFAMGAAYATTFTLRHPDSGYRYLVYGAVFAGGATTGLLRVLGGKHFPSDVTVGAVVGSAVGVTVPLLHRRREAQVAISPRGVSVVGSF